MKTPDYFLTEIWDRVTNYGPWLKVKVDLPDRQMDMSASDFKVLYRTFKAHNPTVRLEQSTPAVTVTHFFKKR